jgi:maleylacetoacetate isomerase
MVELYDYFRSSASFRVRIALSLKNIEYKDIEIHLLKNGGEQHSLTYQKINSQELVPTLKNHEQYISQSLAIIEYLDEVYPEPALLPVDPHAKALVRSFALHIAADIHPLNNLRVLNFLTTNLRISEADKKTWYDHWIHTGLNALEKQLLTLPEYKYCFGDTPTLADICLVPQMFNARRFNCDISPFKRLMAIDDHCQKHPAFQKAWPKESS